MHNWLRGGAFEYSLVIERLDGCSCVYVCGRTQCGGYGAMQDFLLKSMLYAFISSRYNINRGDILGLGTLIGIGTNSASCLQNRGTDIRIKHIEVD
jgi:hypothetical protein